MLTTGTQNVNNSSETFKQSTKQTSSTHFLHDNASARTAKNSASDLWTVLSEWIPRTGQRKYTDMQSSLRRLHHAVRYKFTTASIISHPDYGGSELLWNVSQYLPNYRVTHPRRRPSSDKSPWEPKISPTSRLLQKSQQNSGGQRIDLHQRKTYLNCVRHFFFERSCKTTARTVFLRKSFETWIDLHSVNTL